MLDELSCNRVQLFSFYLNESLSLFTRGLSKQSGFFHFHRKFYEGEPSLAIPFYENMLASLLLLRTKQQEHVHEAKELLSRLFCFRIDREGDVFFPLFLHEYPKKAHESLSLSLMAILWQMKVDFRTILGGPLLEQIEEIFQKLFHQAARKEWSSKEKSLFLILEILEGKRSESELLQDDWLQNHWWKDLRWTALLCLFLERMTDKQQVLFSFMCGLWQGRWYKKNPYGLQDLFYGKDSVPHLFDYYMSMRLEQPMKIQPVVPYFLDIAWINPLLCEKKMLIVDSAVPSDLCSKIALPSIEIKATLFQPKPHEAVGFHPIRLCTEHFSPVMQFPKARIASIAQNKRGMSMTLQSNEESDGDILFQLYIEARQGKVQFFSEKTGQKASYWKGSDSVLVAFDGVQLKISMDSPFSHIQLIKGDRSGQLLHSDEGFDWILEGAVKEGKRGASWNVGIEVCI
jgi:hypothetical protein